MAIRIFENILEALAKRSWERLDERKELVSPAQMAERAREVARGKVEAGECGEAAFPFERALRAPGMSFICEVKRSSPARGIVVRQRSKVDFPYRDMAREYEQAGASAISFVAECTMFGGSYEALREVVQAVDIPVLCKDFVVDEYMIYEARACGASAVVLFCELLDDKRLADYVALAHELGMSALVEAYDSGQVQRAVAAGARVIGINNRDIQNYQVKFDHSFDMRADLGDDCLFVSENHVRSRFSVEMFERDGIDGLLIGERMVGQWEMSLSEKTAALAEFRGLNGGDASGCKIKVSGVKSKEDMDSALAAGVDVVGIVMKGLKSRRGVPAEYAAELVRYLRERAEEIGVKAPLVVGEFTNQTTDDVSCMSCLMELDALEFHGDEDDEYIVRTRDYGWHPIPIIKPFKIRSEKDVVRAVNSKADILLFDGGSGSGSVVDWSFTRGIPRPFFITGGLSLDNAAQAVTAADPFGVNLSVGVGAHGRKDWEKIAAVSKAVREASGGGVSRRTK